MDVTNTVDSHHPRIQETRDPQCTGNIPSKHTRHKPVLTIVGHAEHFLLCLERLDDRHWAEDFLLVDFRIRLRIQKHRRLHVAAGVAVLDPANDELGLLLTTLNHGLDTFELALVDQRPQLDAHVLRIAQIVGRGFHTGDVFLDELIRDVLVHIQPTRRDAHLSGPREDRVDSPGQRVVKVGVVEDDCRALATKLQRHALKIALRGRDLDLLACRDAAGEADLADAHVAGQDGPGVASSGYDLDDAFGKAGLLEQSRQGERAQGGFLRRFRNQYVARHERCGSFTEERCGGRVERTYGGAYA